MKKNKILCFYLHSIYIAQFQLGMIEENIEFVL